MRMEMEGNNNDYYRVLGVTSNSSTRQIKCAYHKLAKQWHPDRWTRCPSVLGEAKNKFQQIQQAYSVLSDERKRKLYDAGLYGVVYEEEDDDGDEEEGFSNFMEEMESLMAQTRRDEKSYSFDELQAMFVEMARGFGFDFDANQCYDPMPNLHGSSWSKKRTRLDDIGFGFFAKRPCCN